MFEIEALNYGYHQTLGISVSEMKQSADDWQRGAEFGYNKAKEDADKMKSQFLELCNLKDMRIAELEKANEWHYVKDGDVPDTECSVLIYCIGGYRIERYYKDKKFFGEFPLNFVHGWQYLPDYIETAKGD